MSPHATRLDLSSRTDDPDDCEISCSAATIKVSNTSEEGPRPPASPTSLVKQASARLSLLLPQSYKQLNDDEDELTIHSSASVTRGRRRRMFKSKNDEKKQGDASHGPGNRRGKLQRSNSDLQPRRKSAVPSSSKQLMSNSDHSARKRILRSQSVGPTLDSNNSMRKRRSSPLKEGHPSDMRSKVASAAAAKANEKFSGKQRRRPSTNSHGQSGGFRAVRRGSTSNLRARVASAAASKAKENQSKTPKKQTGLRMDIAAAAAAKAKEKQDPQKRVVRPRMELSSSIAEAAAKMANGRQRKGKPSGSPPRNASTNEGQKTKKKPNSGPHKKMVRRATVTGGGDHPASRLDKSHSHHGARLDKSQNAASKIDKSHSQRSSKLDKSQNRQGGAGKNSRVRPAETDRSVLTENKQSLPRRASTGDRATNVENRKPKTPKSPKNSPKGAPRNRVSAEKMAMEARKERMREMRSALEARDASNNNGGTSNTDTKATREKAPDGDKKKPIRKKKKPRKSDAMGSHSERPPSPRKTLQQRRSWSERGLQEDTFKASDVMHMSTIVHDEDNDHDDNASCRLM